jgi:hypothetical protein
MSQEGPKPWYYDEDEADTVRVLTEKPELYVSARHRHPKVAPGLGECLVYPLVDGPGVGLIVLLPPVLVLLSLPIFDVIAILEPLTRGNWAFGLLVLPIMLPLMTTFGLVFGYALLFFGHVLVASALGENDHPSWPEFDRYEISEGLVRWFWAALLGLVMGGFPLAVYWLYCGDIDWFDRVILAELTVLAVGFAMMALAASLLHDSFLAANPVTVLLAILRIGWDYLAPSLVGGAALAVAAGMLWSVFFNIPSLKLAMAVLWLFWVYVLYASMVVFRMVGLTYHAHSGELAWFRARPRWGTPARFGRIYSNS